jgi:hypothetical protein
MHILQRWKTIFIKRFTIQLCTIFGTGSSHDTTHNILKNWTQRIFRFWIIADLGFSHSYFSCKNYKELAHARITKVVGFFTANPKKLSLRFSDFPTIFYGFYKIQQKHFCHTRFPKKTECISYVCHNRNFTHMIDKWV